MPHILYTLIIYPLYTLIECIYMFSFRIADNEGIAVIAVSAGITLLCLPLYAVAERWQEIDRKQTAAMKPQLERIKKAFSGDERYMMTNAFYKECHYSPLMSLRSSFGLLIQIPFFLAAYTFLSGLKSLQGVPFLFITDMGAPDELFYITLAGKPRPVNVLPIAMTLINCISGIIYSKGHGLREKIQIFGMAFLFLVVLYNSPAGLVLYWTCNNLFSLVKNIFYKCKNPLKSFYIAVCAICAVLLVKGLFFYETDIQNKFVAALFFLAIYALPLFMKGMQFLLDKPLAPLAESRKLRNTLFLLCCIFLCVLSGYAIPSTLIASSATEFCDIGQHGSPFYYLACSGVQSLGLHLWFVCIYFLFSARVQAAFAAVSFIAAAGAVLNAFVFMLPYGDISASLTFLNAANFRTISFISVLNLAVLVLLAGGVVFIVRLKRTKILTAVPAIGIMALAAISSANSFTIAQSYRAYRSATGDALTSVSPIFHLSSTQPNVILIMLDRAQSYIVPEMLQEDPELARQFSGFTLFENTISFNGHTLQGAPGLYGGYEYTPLEMNKRATEPLVEKNNQAQLVLPRIFSETLGYSATITDPAWPNYAHFCDLSMLKDYPQIQGYQTMGKYTDLWFKNKNVGNIHDSTEETLERNLIFFSLFREAPVCLREMIYKTGTYWSANLDSQDAKTVLDSYALLDYLCELTTVSKTENGTYTSITNNLTHENMFLQAPEYIPADTVTDHGTSRFKDEPSYATQMAAFRLLGKWLDYLKELGAYDNTKIIISADHGNKGREAYFEDDGDLDNRVAGTAYKGRGHYHPLFMFKDIGAREALRVDSSTFMTNADGPSLLLKGLVEQPVNPFTGKEIPLQTEALKQDGVIISANDGHQPYNHGKYTYTIAGNEWWHVKSPISASASWTQTDGTSQTAAEK